MPFYTDSGASSGAGSSLRGWQSVTKKKAKIHEGWKVPRTITGAGLICVFIWVIAILSSRLHELRPGGDEHHNGDGWSRELLLERGFDETTFGVAGSSSLWDVSREDFDGASSAEAAPLGSGLWRRSSGEKRRLLSPHQGLKKLVRGVAPPPQNRQGVPGKGPQQKRGGEPAMLNNFSKEPVDYLNLDDVKEGFIWIPVALDRFGIETKDPLVKMCQVDYSQYSAAPWVLPMGGLLSLHSGCADLTRDTVQVIRISALERVLETSAVPVAKPTGFIFHETRCGSTLVANMLASVRTNVMWSESTGPWKVMHTCPKCPKNQIVRYLKVVMDAMCRSPNHDQFYFKFQSSEDIEPVTTAFPDVPWVFIFREPVEVMMSRLGAQRIGMEGMEKEVTARVEKGMAQTQFQNRLKNRPPREIQTATQLSGLCKKAISAFEAKPATGMVVEYPHLPDIVWTTVLPDHFNVHVSDDDRESMMDTTRMYSKVATFAKGDVRESKFTEDRDTKHNAASVAVTEAAQKFLYSDYHKLKSLQTWYVGQDDASEPES